MQNDNYAVILNAIMQYIRLIIHCNAKNTADADSALCLLKKVKVCLINLSQ